jgi:hypothetical protein
LSIVILCFFIILSIKALVLSDWACMKFKLNISISKEDSVLRDPLFVVDDIYFVHFRN